MPDTVSVGIGCFHFGVKGHLPFTFRGSEYIAEIRRVLEALPSVEGIGIVADNDFENSIVQVATKVPRLTDGTRSFPRADSLQIRFQIYLPRRVQQELLPRDPWAKPPAERYRVTILYGYEMPLAFVESVAQSPPSNPADGVLVVRQFMSNALSYDASENVFFDWIPPTPLGAQCYLTASPTDAEAAHASDFSVHAEHPGGSHILKFQYNPARFDDLERATFLLYLTLLPELDLLYLILRDDQARAWQWAQVALALDGLISLQRLPGPKGFLKRLLTSTRDARDLLLRVAAFEGDMVLARNEMTYRTDNIYGARPDTFIGFLVHNALRDRRSYPTEQVTRSLDLIHSARVKSVDNIIILVASLLSAAAGVLLGHWLPH